MKKEDLLAIAKEAAKNIKTEHDLSQLTKMLSRITIEAALNAELDDHLGYDKNEITGSDNSRNGFTSKTIQTEMASLRSTRRVIETVILNHN